MGAALRPGPVHAAPGVSLQVGVQLYTLRTEMQRGVDAVLARVADIGYTEVEFAGYFDHSPSEIRALLDRHGLISPSAHVGFEQLRNEWQRTLDDAAAVGHRYLTIPWLDAAQYATPDDVRRTAALFNERAAQARAAGIGLAYHNQDFEFTLSGDSVPFDILLARTEPGLVSFQADVYWMTRAGRDPVDYFTRFPGRFSMTHLKDSGGAPDHVMLDVGTGVIDFARVIAAAEAAGVRHHFVEHDDPADPFASVRASHRYLMGLNH